MLLANEQLDLVSGLWGMEVLWVSYCAGRAVVGE